ncbi:MAG: cell division protein FtsQ/DivIB [Tannerella sp.]|jgi:cell division protein FtsQ|nr:cell division protein FtsQ/DivIB [Tannerella sp.]
MKHRRLLRLLALLAALGLLLYLGWMICSAGRWGRDQVCRGLIVSIQADKNGSFISEAEVRDDLRRAGLLPAGHLLRNVNTAKIESLLMKNGMIDQAHVYKTPSGNVRIDLIQKTPILHVMSVTGDFYVDSRGGLMPVSRSVALDLPLVTGYVEKRLATTDLYEFALFLRQDEFWNNQIEQICVLPDQEIELVMRVGEMRVLLGTLDDFREKLANLRLFYEQAIPKVGWNKYSLINLKYKNQVVCTRKQ